MAASDVDEEGGVGSVDVGALVGIVVAFTTSSRVVILVKAGIEDDVDDVVGGGVVVVVYGVGREEVREDEGVGASEAKKEGDSDEVQATEAVVD